MPKPNTQFELSVDDLELIEDALQSQKSALSEQLTTTAPLDEDAKDSLHSVLDLLGRLHNQKEFYRPKSGAYVGG